MAQKILAGRAVESAAGQGSSAIAETLVVKVDQVVLAARPAGVIDEATSLGMRASSVETAVAYDGVCVSSGAGTTPLSEARLLQLASLGFQVARSGLGFAPSVHLERFGAPARLAVTDDPRLAMLGGVGMLVVPVSPHQLAQALVRGVVELSAPRVVQVLLSGRLSAFVAARDVGLELMRRGLEEIVRKIDAQHGAPVVLEFAGSGARLLNVHERSQIAAIAPLVGAQAALFVSDEKTETFLRDQRRSKAHRALFADQGSPSDHVMSLDLATVDPLLLDTDGSVKLIRDLAGRPVHQAVLGGDGGASLRDLLVAAGLLKSKRVPPTLDFMIAPASRQSLEVLAQSSALADLIATGARIIEPDRRFLSGDLYPPGEGRLSLRTCDPTPHAPFVVASTETVSLAVATGEIGDPRSFTRPVRVTVPRVLPTDDVLILKESRRVAAASVEIVATPWPKPVRWAAPLSLRLSPLRSCGDSFVVARDLRQLSALFEAVVLGTALPRVVTAHAPSTLAGALAGMVWWSCSSTPMGSLRLLTSHLVPMWCSRRSTRCRAKRRSIVAGRRVPTRWLASDSERAKFVVVSDSSGAAPDAASSSAVPAAAAKAPKAVRKKSSAS
ncbi:MAG: aconitase family protein [Polyangiaceae bacterium]